MPAKFGTLSLAQWNEGQRLTLFCLMKQEIVLLRSLLNDYSFIEGRTNEGQH